VAGKVPSGIHEPAAPVDEAGSLGLVVQTEPESTRSGTALYRRRTFRPPGPLEPDASAP
jgi:hypothetical protein